MTNGSPHEPRASKNERREAAREKAKELRVAQKRRDRRNSWLLKGGVAVAIVAVLAVVSVFVIQMNRPAGPGPKNMASDGIVIGEGMSVVSTPALAPGEAPTASVPDNSGSVANIVMYIDYLCPYCGQFEQTNGETIRDLVESGAATVEIHPIALLSNRSAGTQYSLRATNAAACVANYSPDAFFDFNASLFVDQPEEGSPGLSNDELKDRAATAGATPASSIDSCIDDVEFKSWAQAATNRARSEPIPNSDLQQLKGTPTVLVNGKQYNGSLDDPQEFSSFVLQAVSSSAGESSTSTPTPTPTPTPAS